MYVNVPVTNLYAKPDDMSEVVSQAIYGWKVKPIETTNDYIKVATPDQYQGWVDKKHLFDGQYEKTKKIAKIIHNSVHIYSVPDTTIRKPIFTLPFEVELNVLEEPENDNNRWIKVGLINGEGGWIHRTNVIINPQNASLNHILELSKQFLGLPYTWGGVSSFGFDCSGYVQMLFRQMGKQLPRDARDQIKSDISTAIDFKEIKGGDLVFFGPHSEKITHVGLCLNSNEMIHATVKPVPVLQITDLDHKDLKERFGYTAAVRII